MSKLCLMINDIKELNYNVDTIIVGINGFNNLNILELSLEEIINIKEKNTNKEVYISINKSIHDKEIDNLKKILFELDKIKIDGVLFDDISVYQISKEENLELNLIWANIHQTTNYNTINVWNELGVKNAFISPDITLDEIINIKKNTNSFLFVPIFGMFDIFSSNRFLITNYLKYINKDKKSDKYYIENNDIKYPIYEDKNGTHIINGKILNGLSESIELQKYNIDYLLINSYMINNIDSVIDSFNKAKKMYETNNVNNEKIKELEKLIDEEQNKGFLYKETFYKVKSDNNER